jgi:hypothetical protein
VGRKYENTIPIDDDLAVLDLLYDDRWEHGIERRLLLPNHHSASDVPELRVWRSEYTVWDFLVAPGVGERLLKRYLVEGKKGWGYTDDCNLSISDAGRQLVRETYAGLGVPYDFEQFHHRLRSDRWLHEIHTSWFNQKPPSRREHR